MNQSTTQQRSFAPPDRKYIQCDAADCGAASPMMRCSRYHLVYYCSKTCQHNHWHEHKDKCVDTYKLKEEAISSYSKFTVQDDCDVLQKFDGSVDALCGVCLEDKITSPYAFKTCGYVFCYPCLQSYQMACKQTGQPLKCPLCRSETEDVERSLWEDAYFNYHKAMREPESSLRRRDLLQTAIQGLDLISNADPNLYMKALSTKAAVLELIGNHEMALNVMDAILEIDKRVKNSMRTVLQKFNVPIRTDDNDIDDNYGEHIRSHPMASELLKELKPIRQVSLCVSHRIEFLIRKAEIYEKIELWIEDYDIFALAFSKVSPLPFNALPTHRLAILTGECRCMYHMHDFDSAIEEGLYAIKLCRHYDGVHKYVALSYKEKGDLEKAIEIMTQAVFYETPWDEENIYQAKLLLDELINTNE
jgi:tetratricopeptide (TPR) repeat protein